MPYPLGLFTMVGVGRDGVRHNKFWECLDAMDGSYRVRWGPIGSEGRCQHVRSDQAQKRIDDKLREGYRHSHLSATTVPERLATDLGASLPQAPVARRARL